MIQGLLSFYALLIVYFEQYRQCSVEGYDMEKSSICGKQELVALLLSE